MIERSILSIDDAVVCRGPPKVLTVNDDLRQGRRVEIQLGGIFGALKRSSAFMRNLERRHHPAQQPISDFPTVVVSEPHGVWALLISHNKPSLHLLT
jgi:hypothetical protein